MFDTHIHTDFSTDSNLNIEDAIQKSRQLDLGLIITEHMDLKFPRKNEFIFNVDEYLNKFEKYRNSKLLLGIELGMRTDCIEENKRIESDFKFDYVLGAVHFVNGVDMFDKNMYKNRIKKVVYEEYFKCMIDCLRSHSYIDSLAHIDYICRYATFDDKDIYYNDYKFYIDEILKFIILNNICIEINSRRLDKKKTYENLLPIYKRYKELGGRYVTIGSDSHSMENIGKHFHTAVEICSSCGLKIVYFKDREMKIV